MKKKDKRAKETFYLCIACSWLNETQSMLKKEIKQCSLKRDLMQIKECGHLINNSLGVRSKRQGQ